MEPHNKQKRSRGRPPKFREARRPITVTLPERTLQQLATIHGDRAQAIVKAAAAALGFKSSTRPLVEVVEAYPGQGVIIVGPSKWLRKIPFLRLVETAPARFLLSIPSGAAVEALEVAVADVLEHLEPDEAYERELLGELLKVMRQRRRRQDVTKAEILLIRTESNG